MQVQNLPSLEGAIANISLPSLCKIPLSVREMPLDVLHVVAGQRVEEGTLVASSSTTPHTAYAPISGVVRGKEKVHTINHAECEALVIELGGALNLSGMGMRKKSWKGRSKRNLHTKIVQSGLPLLASLPLPEAKYTQKYFLVNACEREPFLSVERKLIRCAVQEIVEGAKILQAVYPKAEMIFCLDWRDRTAQAEIEVCLREQDLHWQVQIFKNRRSFFHIDDALLAKTVLKHRHRHVTVLDASDVFAVYEHVVLEKPAIERIVAVGGSAVRTPQFLKARVGVPIAQLVRECGGFVKVPDKIVVGGALTGKTVSLLSSPLTLDCASVTAMMHEDASHAQAAPCIRCGSCVAACPVHLDPQMLFKLLRGRKHAEAREEGLDLCIECGLCAHVCPSRIPLLSIFQKAKQHR